MRVTRLARIVTVSLKHGLDEFALGHARTRALRPFVNAVLFRRDLSLPRAVRLRRALEDLGPIFVKFGQMLSTRRDLATLARIYGKPVGAVFRDFDPTPVASASIAQVHFAELPEGIGAKSGAPVAIKVLRPNIDEVIAIMQRLGYPAERLT